MPLVKTVTYELQGQEGKTVKIGKWTVSKFVALIKDIGEVAGILGEDFKFDKSLSATELAKLLVTLGDTASKKLVRLIVESVIDPKLEDADVLAWDLEDFTVVLTKLIELNFTENLSKNFRGLKGALSERVKSAPQKSP